MGMDWDEDALRAFLAGPYRRVLRTVRLASGSDADAEDAVQEAIARAWERRADIDHAEAWVLTVALNLTRSRWRTLLRYRKPAAVQLRSGEEDLVTAEWLLILRDLPRRQREVAVLHYVDDLPLASIAEIVGTTEGAVKNALFNARRALADALDGMAMEERAR